MSKMRRVVCDRVNRLLGRRQSETGTAMPLQLRCGKATPARRGCVLYYDKYAWAQYQVRTPEAE
jgi:hypothetical protein